MAPVWVMNSIEFSEFLRLVTTPVVLDLCKLARDMLALGLDGLEGEFDLSQGSRSGIGLVAPLSETSEWRAEGPRSLDEMDLLRDDCSGVLTGDLVRLGLSDSGVSPVDLIETAECWETLRTKLCRGLVGRDVGLPRPIGSCDISLLMLSLLPRKEIRLLDFAGFIRFLADSVAGSRELRRMLAIFLSS
mmetsp:Transcript_45414/g.71193  ORF Transcript_45414/g.71193 Transcript_45414/m.71193 type:complete len:189 (+) Transcript_45414:271-837(+)